MIIVTAEPDPVQKALRDRKKNWSKKMVSPFIDDLINLKRLMNGAPGKFNMAANKITEPLPSDPATILGVLAGDFQKIVNEGNAIIKDQLRYSQTRRKKQPKQMELPLPATTTSPPQTPMNDLSKQLSLPAVATFDDNYAMVIEASNRLSRFLAKMKGPWFGRDADRKRYRISILKAVYDLYKLCSKFQLEVLGSSKPSIDRANALSKHMKDALLSIGMLINNVAVNLGEDVTVAKPPSSQAGPSGSGGATDATVAPGATGEAAPPASNISVTTNDPQIDSAQNALIDFNNNYPEFLQQIDQRYYQQMQAYEAGFNTAPNIANKAKIAGNILRLYTQLLQMVQAQFGIPGSSFSEILKARMGSTASENAAQINKVADAFLRKWLKKLRHKTLSDKTSTSRIIAYEQCENIRKSLDEMMDSLEEDFDYAYLKQSLGTIWDDFHIMERNLGTLLPEVKYELPEGMFTGKTQEKLEKDIAKKRFLQMSKELSKAPTVAPILGGK